jgi:hypothetical protein
VVALVLGVLTMHATPVLCSPASDEGHVTAVSHSHADSGAVASGPDQGADCASHHMLAACLVILAMGLMLAALRLLGWLSRDSRPAAQAGVSGPVVGSRVPVPEAPARLAELCVSRR